MTSVPGFNLKKRNLSANIKSAIISNLTPTSLFHCLYRLRLRSNYLDADSFIEAIGRTDWSNDFNVSLRKINWHTLFLLEMLIARHIGKTSYKNVLESFEKKDHGNRIKGLARRRWEVFCQFW